MSMVSEVTKIAFFLLPLTEVAVERLVEILRYKPEGCGFDSLWGLWRFSSS